MSHINQLLLSRLTCDKNLLIFSSKKKQKKVEQYFKSPATYLCFKKLSNIAYFVCLYLLCSSDILKPFVDVQYFFNIVKF